MLEFEDDQMNLSLYEQWERDGYNKGKRIGLAEICCDIFIKGRASKNDKLLSLLSTDIIEELTRFYSRYGNLPDRKMAEHLINESELIIGFWD